MFTGAFGESTVTRTQVQLQYNRFKEGREDVNNDASLGRPSMSTTDENFEAVKKMILDNRRITFREVADDVGISFTSCQAIFTYVLGKKRAGAKIVPKLLNFKQKQRRMDIAQQKGQKVVTNHGCMAWALKPKPNHPNGSVQKCQERKKYVKFGQM